LPVPTLHPKTPDRAAPEFVEEVGIPSRTVAHAIDGFTGRAGRSAGRTDALSCCDRSASQVANIDLRQDADSRLDKTTANRHATEAGPDAVQTGHRDAADCSSPGRNSATGSANWRRTRSSARSRRPAATNAARPPRGGPGAFARRSARTTSTNRTGP
jgi:hypothetical protein